MRKSAIHRLYGSALMLVMLQLVPTGYLVGQETGGELNGAVKDSSGAVIPPVAVTITNKTTSRMFHTTTGIDGKNLARNLEPGRYMVRFEIAGSNGYIFPIAGRPKS